MPARIVGDDRPALLYSIGKDSSVMLHLALKAFAPGRMPFPLVNVDTGFKFAAMTRFRDQLAAQIVRGLTPTIWSGIPSPGLRPDRLNPPYQPVRPV